MESSDKKKTGWRKMTANDLKKGIDLSKTIRGFRVVETRSDKKKTKELDWHIKWDYLLNKKKWKNPDEVNKILTKFIEDLLIQQRTEILEEIPKKIKGKNKEFVEGYNNAIDDITNLLNKKDD